MAATVPSYEKPTVDQKASAQYVNFILIVGIAAFVTTFAQTAVIGRVPLQFLLKNYYHFNRTGVANFFFLMQLAWDVKPIAGLLIDSVPLFGKRRRNYMIISALLSTIMWALLGTRAHQYALLFWGSMLLNVFMMIASTTMGALLVEGGQKFGATGRLSSVREGVQNACYLIMGPVGGWLATHWFGYTAGIGAASFLVLTVAAFFLLREPGGATVNRQVWADAGQQLRTLGTSKSLWSAVGLLLFVFIAPSLGTTLLFYQTNTLHLDPQFIGNLYFIDGVGGILGALAYSYFCKRISLRPLLYLGTVLNVLGALSYLVYHNKTEVVVIEFLSNLLGTFGVLPIYDFAARSTPKGSEALGFSLMMGARNLALFGSDRYISSPLADHGVTFHTLVLINAGTTALVLLVIPFLASGIMNRREGEHVASSVPNQMPGGEAEVSWQQPITLDDIDKKS